MAKYAIDGGTLTAIADAIREKTGGTGEIVPEDMAAAVAALVVAAELRVESGTFTASDTVHTLAHTLGEVPVFAMFRQGVGSLQISASSFPGDRPLVAASVRGGGTMWTALDKMSDTLGYLRMDTSNDDLTGNNAIIHGATKTEIQFGRAGAPAYHNLVANAAYAYVLAAIAAEGGTA